MCVAVPGRIVSVSDSSGPSLPATVAFPDGSCRDIDLALLAGASVGDYVLVHSGYAVATVSEQSALASYRLFAGLHAT